MKYYLVIIYYSLVVLVPIVVISYSKEGSKIPSLLLGTLLGGIFYYFQPNTILEITDSVNEYSLYEGVINSIGSEINIKHLLKI